MEPLKIRWFRLALYFLLGVVAFSYITIFDNDFVGDDRAFIQKWELTRSIENIPQLIGGSLPEGHQGNYRPIRSLLYLGMYQVFGTSIWGYHLFSLCIHLGIVVVVTLISTELFSSKKIGLVSGLLFGLHPIHVEAITFMTASFDTAAFLFLLSSFYLHILPQRKYKSFELILFLLALGTNEIALAYPLLLSSYHFWYSSGLKGSWSIKIILEKTQMQWMFAIGYLILRFGFIDLVSRGGYWGDSVFYSLILSCKSLGYYIFLLIFPIKLGLIHTLPGGISTFMYKDLLYDVVRSQSLLEFSVLSVIVGLGIFGMYTLKVKKTLPLLGFSFSWMILSLLPVLNVIPSAVLLSERYAYLSSLGYIWLVAVVFSAFTKFFGEKIAVLFVALVATVYFGVSVYTNQFWDNEIIYWQKNVADAPHNFLAYSQLAQAYQSAYLLDEAIEAFSKAVTIEPSYSVGYNNLGLIFHYQKKHDQAKDYYEKAVAVSPQNQDFKNNLSRLLYHQAIDALKTNNVSEALMYITNSLEYQPQNKDSLELKNRLCSQLPADSLCI